MLIFDDKKPPEFRLDFARMLCLFMDVSAEEVLEEDDPILPLLLVRKKSAYK
jgi:hypothetical protein